MKCLVLSFLMGYNDHVYKRGEYVDVVNNADLKRMVRNKNISLLPEKEGDKDERKEEDFPYSSSILNANQKAAEEKAEEEGQAKKAGAGKQIRTVKKGVKKPNGKNDKL